MSRIFPGTMWGNIIKYVGIFAAVFVYLTTTNNFYPPAKLRLSGVASSGCAVQIQYDLGDGFKSFQQESLAIAPDPQTGAFLVSLSLPQTRIDRLQIASEPEPSAGGVECARSTQATIERAGTEIPVELSPVEGALGTIIRLEGTVQPVFSRALLLFHVCLTCFIVVLLYPALRATSSLNTSSLREVLRTIFFKDGRGLFWSMFLIACVVHSCWLLAYWPASMTNDSWISLMEVQSLTITDWHPYPYTYWLLAMMHLFHSVAAIALSQIIATSSIMSYILWYCYRYGTPRIVVALFYCLFLVSIPIGLFNTILWKDIPFSVAVLVLSFLVFKAGMAKKLEQRYLSFSAYQFILLAILFIVVCQFRHNGLIFYGLIPLLFLGKLAVRDYVRMQAILALVFVMLNLIIPGTLGIARTKASPQQEYRTALAIMTHYNFYSKNRELDQKIIEDATKMSWDEITQLFPRNWFDAWDRSEIQKRQFLPGNGHTDSYNKSFIARLSLTNLPILISSRAFEFFHSIGIDQSAYDFTTNFFQNPLQLHGTNLGPPGAMRFKVSIDSDPPSLFIREQLTKIAKWSMEYDGLLSRQVLIWNLLVFLVLQLVIIFIEGGLSSIGLFTVPGLACAAAVFAAGAGESWRYFYYIYLTGLVTLPLYLCFLRNKLRR